MGRRGMSSVVLRLYQMARWKGTPQRIVPAPGPHQPPTTTPPHPSPLPQLLTSSSVMLSRDSEVPRRTEWPLARDVDDRRRLRAPLQLLGMLKAQRLW